MDGTAPQVERACESGHQVDSLREEKDTSVSSVQTLFPEQSGVNLRKDPKFSERDSALVVLIPPLGDKRARRVRSVESLDQSSVFHDFIKSDAIRIESTRRRIAARW
jgi:hypothetical protein